MKNVLIVLSMCLLVLVLPSCKEAVNEPVAADDAATIAWYRSIDAEIASADTADTNRNFIAILSGREEVPAKETRGRGVAKFQLNRDGLSIHYKLIVANIANVVGAHIHKAAKGEIGPIVFGLYAGAPGGGRTQGPIAEGNFTAADLAGPLAGSETLALFLENLHADSLYVNVHTNDGIDPPNTGKGDFPGGEIRGQVK
jgi:hypothetical protein